VAGDMGFCESLGFAEFVLERWRVRARFLELRSLAGKNMYIDLITKIKNAQQAKKALLKSNYSKMDLEVAEILAKNGFIESVVKKGRMPKRSIEVTLKYDGEEGVINGVRFLSKPSRKLYTGYRELGLVKQGYGIAVLSTPKGLMTARRAKKEKVGGVLLFEIW